MPNHVICIQPDSETDGENTVNNEMACVEWENSAHKNGNIESTAAISSPGENSDCLPERDRQSESVSNNSSDRNEVFKYHTKLAVLAEYLADITTATLWQSNFTKEDIEFGHLIHDCGEELYGIGEYLIDACKQIAE